ncbi:hypothetical protein PF003_g6199 [Phytophthora fragariae]|nr:hypothetical protein PF003_g6199 [Phytophthora fragariae]
MMKNQQEIYERAARLDDEEVNAADQDTCLPAVIPRVPHPIFAIVNPPLIDDILRERCWSG